jgi:ketosteroid isomerase-like protein
MPTTMAPTREEAQIRKCVDSLAQALRAKDIKALMAHYAPDNVTFDFRPPLQVQGVDAYRKNFEAWFASVQGRIDYEISRRVMTSHSVTACVTSRVRGRPERRPITGYV